MVIASPPRGTMYCTPPYCCCCATTRYAPYVPAFAYVCETVAGGLPEPLARAPSPNTSSHETIVPGMFVPSVNFTASGCVPDVGEALRLSTGGVPPPTVTWANDATSAYWPGL